MMLKLLRNHCINGSTHELVASKGGWYNLKMSDRFILQLSSRTLVERAS